MRQLRICPDTGRVVASVSPRTRPRRDVEPLARQGDDTGPGQSSAASKAPGTEESGGDSDSELALAPSRLHGHDDSESIGGTAGASRKRKSGADTVPTTSTIGDLVATGSEHVTPSNRPARPALAEIANPNGNAKKPQRWSARKIKRTGAKARMEPPADWEEVYKLTKEMRAEALAPVDTMGSSHLAEETSPPRDRRFQTLVSLMLSAQTRDTVTAAVMKTLQANLSGGLTLESIRAVPLDRLDALIGKVTFHHNKARYIKQTAEELHARFGSDIPDTVAGLTSLPGVGPKMAFLTMSVAWGRDEGIGVDVHVHRITNLWGWHETRTPEETRASLEAWLPREKWHEINGLLVGFGQTICLPVGRRCGRCLLAERGLCPSAAVGREREGKRVRVEEKLVEGGDAVVKGEVAVGVKHFKAEEIDGPAPDIEDLGTTQGRSSRRVIT
ncbi:hypothetical protein B0A49_10884 [Cryomyces minteri]|uniref:Endonuclease III homolog n=1 Tax=Cryomyces minteri TaxID=331657 RepID=A0A4U0WJS7_9PEZI|nr:hypothetical protein B0A49_10884 [Cryomyces minteri]